MAFLKCDLWNVYSLKFYLQGTMSIQFFLALSFFYYSYGNGQRSSTEKGIIIKMEKYELHQ